VYVSEHDLGPKLRYAKTPNMASARQKHSYFWSMVS